MNTEIAIKMRITADQRANASVRVEFEDGGGFTMTNILVQKKADGSGVKMTMPLMLVSGTKRPAVTLQGSLKQDVEKRLEEEYFKMLGGKEVVRRCVDD